MGVGFVGHGPVQLDGPLYRGGVLSPDHPGNLPFVGAVKAVSAKKGAQVKAVPGHSEVFSEVESAEIRL